MRDTKPRRRRNRLATVLLFPALAVVWLIGWSLSFTGRKKDEAQPKTHGKPSQEHVTLIPANSVENESEVEEEDDHVTIAAVDD